MPRVLTFQGLHLRSHCLIRRCKYHLVYQPNPMPRVPHVMTPTLYVYRIITLKISSILVHETERRQYSRKEYHTWLSCHNVMSWISYLLSNSLWCCARTVKEVEIGLSDGRCGGCLGNVLLCFGLMMRGNVVLGCFGIGRLGF